MKINTKYFGALDYSENEILNFKDGLFGFENNKKYLLIHFDDDNDFMLCLQNVEDETLSFVVMNPFYLMSDYSPILLLEDLEYLEAKDNSEISYYVIAVMKDSIEDSTINLKCPIAIKSENRQARQVIIDNLDYIFRHPIKEFSVKEE